MYFLSIMPRYITVNVMKKILSFLFVLFFASQAFAPIEDPIYYDCSFEESCSPITYCQNNVCRLTYSYFSSCTCDPICPPMYFDEASCVCDGGVLNPI